MELSRRWLATIMLIIALIVSYIRDFSLDQQISLSNLTNKNIVYKRTAAKENVTATVVNSTAKAEPAADEQYVSPYLTPQLDKLVRAWEQSTMTAEDAKQEIWEIVSSKTFIEHRPNRGIVFIKTHKTGGSTVTSVLHGLATSHNLTTPVTMTTFFDPRSKAGRKRVVHRVTTTPGVTFAPYDIWTNHVIFHESLLTEVVPSSEGKYFSIVRDPATRMRSACAFYKCCSAETIEIYADFVLSEKAKLRKEEGRFIKDCHLDESFSEINGSYKKTSSSTSNPEDLEAMQGRLRSGDLLLLVTERFAESVIVLRDFYNLHPLDVAYFAKKQNKKIAKEVITEELQEKIEQAFDLMREWNPFDHSIHMLANSLLTKKMEELFPRETVRERVIEEVELLNDLLYHACAHDLDNVTPELNSWCFERALDNLPWNRMHLRQILNSNRKPTPDDEKKYLQKTVIKT